MVDQKISRHSMGGGLIHIKELGFEPKTVIDVGAALGTFCLYEIFPDSRHILIEPIRENEPYLVKICKNLNNAEYLIAAATKELGLFTINIDPNLVHSSVSDPVSSSEENFYSRTIDGITLDWICEEKELEPPYLIKVDVDGNETDVLAGATRMLGETEYIIVEVGLFTQIFNVIECMKAQGFVIYDIVDLMWRPLDNALWQCDIAFVKESGQFRKNKAYIQKEQTERMTTGLKNYRENLIAYIEERYSEANALSKQAAIYYDKGQFKEAIAASKQAIELKPDLASGYLTMGNALQMLGDFDEAIASYSKALEIQPDLVAAIANLGNVYLNQGKLDDAKSSYKEAIALDPQLAIAYWNLGQVLQKENKLEEAMVYWQKAVELQPELKEYLPNVNTISYNNKVTSIKENLKLRDINLVIFPDWSKSEESLGVELQKVIKAIASHPDKSKITLLVDNSNISVEDADLILSSVAMNLLMEEELEVNEGPEIVLIGEFSQIQWQNLFSLVQGRIVLENENQEAIDLFKVENIPTIKLDNLQNKIFYSFQTNEA